MGNSYYRLCGGVFLKLILEMRDLQNNMSVDSDVYNDLVSFFLKKGSNVKSESFNIRVSNYLNCRDDLSKDFMRNSAMQRDQFDVRIRDKYHFSLEKMSTLVEQYISDDDAIVEKSVKELIALIQQDNSIPPEQEFYINPDGSTIKKEQLNALDSVCLPAFLLGVWHYILMNRNTNTEGRDTADKLYPLDDERKRPYIGHLGDNIQREIKINRGIEKSEESNDRKNLPDIEEGDKVASQEDSVDMAVEQKENDDAEDNSHHKVEEEEEILNDDMGSPEKETAGKIFNSTVGGSHNQVNIYNNYAPSCGDSGTPAIQNMGTIRAPFTKQGIMTQEVTSSEPINHRYYNLFVAGERKDLDEEKGILSIPLNRLLDGDMEYEIEEKFKKSLHDNFEEVLKVIKTLPSLFLVENEHTSKAADDQFVIFGYVKDIERYGSGWSALAKVRFSKIRCDIKQQLLNEHAEDFGLLWPYNNKINDLNRTHWMIKKRDLIEELRKVGINV